MADYALSAKITGDSSEFERAINRAQKSADVFESRMSGVSSKLKSAGGAIAGWGTKLSLGVTAPLSVAGKSMINAASDFDENLNKVDVAFGKNAQSVKDWSETAITQFGLSKNQALEAASLFGDMATSMGLTQPAAAEMSMSLAGLAGDMASFKNVDIEQAMAALNGVFTGETESLKQLGIVMTETNLEEFAEKTGQVYAQMSQAEKVQLRYNYVLAMSQNAQGDYARTADGTANSIRTFQGSVNNLMISLGQNLLPVFTPLIQKATELVNAFSNADPKIQKIIVTIAGIAAVIGPALLMLGTMVSSVGSVVGAVGQLGGVITVLAGVFAYLVVTNEDFQNKMIEIWDSIQAKIQSVAGGIDFSGMFGRLSESLSGVYAVVSDVFSRLNIPVGLFAAGFIGILLRFQSPLNSFAKQVLSVGGSIATGLGGAVLRIIPTIEMLFSKFHTVGGILGLVKAGMSGLGSALSGFCSPASLVVGAIALLAGGFATLMVTNEGFRNTVLSLVQSIGVSLTPVITMLGEAIIQIATAVMPVLISAFNQILPLIGQVIIVILQVIAALAPMITQLMSVLLPVIVNIVEVVMNVVQAVMPAVIAILNVIMSVIQALVPVITNILSVVVDVISGVIAAIGPVVSFIGGVITAIMAAVTPIVTFIADIVAGVIRVISTIVGAVTDTFSTVFTIVSDVFSSIMNFISNVINEISSAIAGLIDAVSYVFNSIYQVVDGVMTSAGNVIRNVLDGIQWAWNGLTGFVSGVFDGVWSAVQGLVDVVKGFVNGVISGINWAIDLINMIPGVSIGYIPYLLHGTDDWAGGFARMNEGGRGELTYLPNGAQVIPHDISVKYAKESARANSAQGGGAAMDYDRLITGLAAAMSNVQVEHVTSLNGRAVAHELTPLISANIAAETSRKRGR